MGGRERDGGGDRGGVEGALGRGKGGGRRLGRWGERWREKKGEKREGAGRRWGGEGERERDRDRQRQTDRQTETEDGKGPTADLLPYSSDAFLSLCLQHVFFSQPLPNAFATVYSAKTSKTDPQESRSCRCMKERVWK